MSEIIAAAIAAAAVIAAEYLRISRERAMRRSGRLSTRAEDDLPLDGLSER